MPANRQATSDRAAREAGLLDAAEALFLSAGFEATSVRAIAARAGVTSNTVYWYFPSKEHVLVAVLERWLAGATDVIERRPPEPARVASLVVAILRELQPLLGVLHRRASRSDELTRFHERFHQRIRTVLARGLRSAHASAADAQLAADVLVATAEGALEHPGPSQARVIDAALRAAVAERPAGGSVV